MRPVLVSVLLVLSTLAGMTTGGVGLLLAGLCADGAGRGRLAAVAIAAVALSLIAAPLCAWLVVPPTRQGPRAALAGSGLALSLLLIKVALGAVEAAARP